jgi:alpha-galactosidase
MVTIRAVLAAALAFAGGWSARADGLGERIRTARPVAIAVDPARSASLEATIRWDGDLAWVSLRNAGTEPVAVREVVLFDLAHGLAADTPFYGEGLQMLAQTAGTLAAPVDVGTYPDRSHYRLPEPEGFRRVYSLLTLEPRGAMQELVAFTTCRRFIGAFDVSATRLRATIDGEGIAIEPGETWSLENLMLARGPSRGDLLAELAREIAKVHPRTPWPSPPTGWCSWYCFGPRVTATDVLDNLAAMRASFPDLEFVQVDDGYQPTMGDWLETGPGFGGRPIGEILREIRAGGREPAIWVAPFVASPDSRLLRERPELFIAGDDGTPLPSDRVMFGGWRLGPWSAIDGSDPAAQAWLAELFATMRREWGVRYFKLDATFWGLMHGGKRHDPKATRVDAFRRGMEAIRRGAGADAYLLGCNQPMWPSLGLIDGSRSSLDIGREWSSVSSTGRENLLRGWQNGTLWWNDPDAVVLTGLPESEVRFHATLIHATGGAVLSGDDLSRLPEARVPTLRMLSRPTGVAARFDDLGLEVGRIPLGNGTARYALLNWSGDARSVKVTFDRAVKARDVWSGNDLGTRSGETTFGPIAPHDAMLIEVAPAD